MLGPLFGQGPDGQYAHGPKKGRPDGQHVHGQGPDGQYVHGPTIQWLGGS